MIALTIYPFVVHLKLQQIKQNKVNPSNIKAMQQAAVMCIHSPVLFKQLHP